MLFMLKVKFLSLRQALLSVLLSTSKDSGMVVRKPQGWQGPYLGLNFVIPVFICLTFLTGSILLKTLHAKFYR